MDKLVLEKNEVFLRFMLQSTKKNGFSTSVENFVAYVNKFNGEITIIDRNTYEEDAFDIEADAYFYKIKDDIKKNPQNYIQFPEKPYCHPEIDDPMIEKILNSWAETNNIVLK